MTDTTNNLESTSVYQMPRGAYETFIIVAAFGFLLLSGFTFAYGRYGERFSGGLDAACAEAAFQAGRKFEQRGNNAGALVRYRQAMEGRFKKESQRLMCGRAIGDLLHKQHRYSEAIAEYEKLPAEAFNEPGAYTGYVTSLWREGRLTEAREKGRVWLELANWAKDEDQQIWARHALMRIAEEDGRHQDALTHGEAMLAIRPAGDAHMHLVRVLRAMNRHQEARGHAAAYLESGDDPKLREEAQSLLPLLDKVIAALDEEDAPT